MREAGLTAAQAPHGRPGSDASALQVTRACEQSEEVAWRDDAPTTPRLTRQHESTRSHLVQPRHVQTASAPTQRTDADAGDAKKGCRAPARASRLADAPRHASSATRRRGDGVRGGSCDALFRRGDVRSPQKAAAAPTATAGLGPASRGFDAPQRGRNASAARGTRDTPNVHHLSGRSAAPARETLWQRSGETVSSECGRVSLHGGSRYAAVVPSRDLPPSPRGDRIESFRSTRASRCD